MIALDTNVVVRLLTNDSYKFPVDQVNRALVSLPGLENVEVDAPVAAALALGWHAEGLDFADALHVASTRAECFKTFDQKLVKRAAALGVQPAVSEALQDG